MCISSNHGRGGPKNACNSRGERGKYFHSKEKTQQNNTQTHIQHVGAKRTIFSKVVFLFDCPLTAFIPIVVLVLYDKSVFITDLPPHRTFQPYRAFPPVTFYMNMNHPV